MEPWFTPGLSCWYVWAMNLQNIWLSRQVKTAVKSYLAKKRAKKYAESRLKEERDAFFRSIIHSRMEQYKKDNNIEE